MLLSGQEKSYARSFVAARMQGCDEFVQNEVYAYSKWIPKPKLDNVRNILYVNGV